MQLDTIFLDIDGVCNLFHQHVYKCLGVPYNGYDDYPVECGWDMVAAANKLCGFDRFTASAFWNSITREMWADTPVSDEFAYILQWAEQKVGKENVQFLTAPTLDPDCVAGKLEWIQRSTPRWMHRQYLIGPAKHLLAQPGRLLVDDSDTKILAFEKYGGSTVLVPRPWNTSHGRKDVLAYLEEVLPWF